MRASFLVEIYLSIYPIYHRGGDVGRAMFVVSSLFAAHPPPAAEACASTRAGDSKTAQCSSWCGPAHCGSWCKCRACAACTSPTPPPPPRSPAPPPPPRSCTSKVAGDANVEGCASWCREKESAATLACEMLRPGRPFGASKQRPSQLGSGAASFTRVGSLSALQVQVVRLLREQSGPLAAAFACRRRASSGAPHAGCRAGPAFCRPERLHTQAPRRPCEAGMPKLLQARGLRHLL